jgi:molecular chaperone DnaK
MNELNAAWQAASQEMYASSGGAQPGAQPNAGDAGNASQGGGNSGGGDAQDVEYEEVKK